MAIWAWVLIVIAVVLVTVVALDRLDTRRNNNAIRAYNAQHPREVPVSELYTPNGRDANLSESSNHQ